MRESKMKHRLLVAVFVLLFNSDALAENDLAPVFDSDPHRNELGFFDMHICNWADRPMFFKSLFSTIHFKNIEMMTVYSPDGKKVTDLDMSKFMHLKKKGKPVPGATHYKVFMRDGYETTQILNSKLIKEPRLKLKPGLLKPGGYYLWKVHARDVNENIILGDFNSGSVNKWMEFSVVGVD